MNLRSLALALSLSASPAAATTYTYEGGLLNFISTCTYVMVCPTLPPAALTAEIIFPFDASGLSGTYTSGFSGTLPTSIYSDEPIYAWRGNESVTLTNGRITDWHLYSWIPSSSPGNFLITSDGDTANFYSGAGLWIVSGTSAPGQWSGPITDTYSTPLPAAFPLFATGLALLGLLNWRRKA